MHSPFSLRCDNYTSESARELFTTALNASLYYRSSLAIFPNCFFIFLLQDRSDSFPYQSIFSIIQSSFAIWYISYWPTDAKASENAQETTLKSKCSQALKCWEMDASLCIEFCCESNESWTQISLLAQKSCHQPANKMELFFVLNVHKLKIQRTAALNVKIKRGGFVASDWKLNWTKH